MQFAYFLLLLVASFTFAQKKSAQTLENEISPVIEKYITEKKIPGAVLAVKKGDKTVFIKAYGYTKLKEFDG